MHAVILGASKGCGYHALVRLLAIPEWTATILLRKPASIEADQNLKGYLTDGRLKIVQGDATRYEDVKSLFDKKVDVVISTIGRLIQRSMRSSELMLGASPGFGLRGITNDQPHLCIDGAIALLRVLSELESKPRVIVTSSMGIGKDHANLPFVMRVSHLKILDTARADDQVLYKTLLDIPHQDKAGLEYLIRLASNTIPTPSSSDIPPLLASIDHSQVSKDFLPEVIIVRPAAMMGSGAPSEIARGAEQTIVGEGATVWTINRAEVGRFIVEECLPGNEEWVNKAPTIGWK